MLKKIYLFILLIHLFSNTEAHQGGHYTQKDINSLHHWNINGQTLIGNFMMWKDNSIIIEGIHGKLYSIPYFSIRQTSDLNYANLEIQRIEHLNQTKQKV